MSQYALVLDLSEYQNPESLREAQAAGVEGVFLRCIRGNGETDDRFLDLRARALSIDLCVGAYIFLNDSAGEDQADKLIAVAGPGVALALDWEVQSVQLATVEACAQRIFDKTGIWPLLYGSVSFLQNQNIPTTSVLANCPLWLAKYGPPPEQIPSPWQTWSIWQYTDARSTGGVGNSDADYFHRPPGSLADWWKDRVTK